MSSFNFKLQRVLDYRETLEQDAENAYRAAQSERIRGEAVFAILDRRRDELCEFSCPSLDDRIAIQASLEFVDDKEREQRLIVQALEIDEAEKREAWLLARQDAEALRKLRESSFEEWKIETERREQAELDEFAILRRAS